MRRSCRAISIWALVSFCPAKTRPFGRRRGPTNRLSAETLVRPAADTADLFIGSVRPTTTNSSRCRQLTLTQAAVARRQGASTRFESGSLHQRVSCKPDFKCSTASLGRSAHEERYRDHAGRRLEGPNPPFSIHQRDQGDRANYQYGVIRRDVDRVAHGATL